jgi:cytochrome c-type biogenesis protein CcmH/NrfG
MSARPTNKTAAVAFALALLACACGRGTSNANVQGASTAAASPLSSPTDSGGFAADFTKLDADVAQLEERAERNPGDDDALTELAKAYVRRGNAHRAANQLKEALQDYRRAQSADPDNPDAQRNAAEISPLVEGAQTGEVGEPAPLPITPGVTADDDNSNNPKPKGKKQ